MVVTEDGREFRVPWPMLTRLDGRPRRRVSTRIDAMKVLLRPGDRVSFRDGGGHLHGRLVRMNPKSATVDCGAAGRLRVPYTLLRNETPGNGRTGRLVQGKAAQQAERLMEEHGLAGWSFQFDDTSKRAGCCDYGLKVISLARLYCLVASDEEIRDTILHEIAHALAGPEHNHDQHWKSVAHSIGCTGERCHSADFAPPRYIVSCRRCRWFEKATLRRRNARCKTCRGPVTYRFFSFPLWEELRTKL